MTREEKTINPAHEPAPAINRASRFVSLDLQRGLIMVLMAIDHASYFVAHVHAREFWGTSLPVYPDQFWFLTRVITHPAAPGFFVLMGAGMALFAAARLRLGWTEARITGFFLVRGIILIILQILVENPAWMAETLMAKSGMTALGAVPGGGGSATYLGVLFALGSTMAFWAVARRAGTWLIIVISLSAIMVTQIATPGPTGTDILYTPLVRAALIPGHTDGWIVFYPVIPWLGVTGLGILFGRLLMGDPRLTWNLSAWAGAGLALVFALVRVTGGFGNLNAVPPGWMGFLNVVKYPPALSFLAVTLSVNLLLIALWSKFSPRFGRPANPLVLFGRTALFFYLVHLWLYCLLGALFRAGHSLPVMYAAWLAGLVILYPLCYWYNRFKGQKPPTSLWRFF